MYIHVCHESYRKRYNVETNFKQMGMRSHDIPMICYALDAPPSPRPTVPTRERRDQGGLLIGSHLRGTASTAIHRDVSPSAQAEWRIDWYPRWPGITSLTSHPKNSAKNGAKLISSLLFIIVWTLNSNHLLSSLSHLQELEKMLRPHQSYNTWCRCCGTMGSWADWLAFTIWSMPMELWSLRPRASSDRSAFLVHRWPESPSGHAGWNMKVVHGVASVLLNLVYFSYHFCRLRMPWDDTAIPVPDLHLIIKPMIFSHVISRCQTMMAKGEALTEYSPKRTVMDWKGWHRLVEISDMLNFWKSSVSEASYLLSGKSRQKWIKFE